MVAPSGVVDRTFRNRRALAALLFVLGTSNLVIAAASSDGGVIGRVAGVITGLFLVVASVRGWGSGISVNDQGVRIRRMVWAFPSDEEFFAWSDIEGFDDPEVRLGGRSDRGSLSLHVTGVGSLRLPQVRDKAALARVLVSRLGPPGPR